MNGGERTKRIEELFRLAVLVTREERAAFVLRHAADDPALAEELLRLLAQDDQGTKAYLESPVLSGCSRGGSDTSRGGDPSVAREIVVGSRIDRIGRYQIERELGEGGMGAVYLAEQLEPVRRKVALKIVKLGMDTRRVVARFERERQALALMDHPGIARIYDGGATDSGRPYFVMEYVPGIPFTDYCDRAKLDVRGRLGLFVRVCEAIQHAHQRGIVHRDLKPGNVLVADRDGSAAPKVIDFGVARATAEGEESGDRSERPTRASEVIGTYAYMSPEQADPASGPVGPHSDVYSLGVLLYELLSGALPVDVEELRGKSPSEVSRLLTDTDPPAPSTKVTRAGAAALPCARRRGGLDPRTLARRLSGDLDWITLKAMERDPERRYRTAAELASDVRRHLAHEAVLAGPPDVRYRVGKYLRRHKVGAGATAALVLALASGAAGTTLGFRRAHSEARTALAALADEAAARARVEDTSEMLFTLLDLANPEATWHGDESAVALLHQLAADIGATFGGDPAGEARLRLNVGRVLRTLGDFDFARGQLERVQELEPLYGASLVTRADTARELHRLEVDSSGHADYDTGLAAARLTAAVLSVQAPDAGAAALNLVDHVESRNFSALSDDLNQLELSLAADPSAEKSLLAADVVGIAGGYLGLHFAFPEAAPLLARAHDLRAAVQGPLHPEAVRGLGDLVEHLLQQGQSDAAAGLLAARLKLAVEALPAGHWLSAELESRLGECLSLAGREGEAEGLLADAREALIRERGPRSRPALEAGLRLRDHYARSGDEELLRELDLALGEALGGGGARDRQAAWGRTLVALGADSETAEALVSLLNAAEGDAGSPEAGRAAASDLAGRLAAGSADGAITALVERALAGVAPRAAGTPLGSVLEGALALARTRLAELKPSLPEALAVEPRVPRSEEPTLEVDDAPLPDLAPGEPRSDLPAAPAEAPETWVDDAEVALEEPAPAAESGPDAVDFVLLAWSMAQPDHGYDALYLLAAEASTLGVALAPENPDFLAVKALAFARIKCGTFALDCLAQEELETGSTNAIGWAARAMVMLDAHDAEQAELALEEAIRLAQEDLLAVPTGMDALLKELQQRLVALQHGNGGASAQEGLNGPLAPARQASDPAQPLGLSAQPLSSFAKPQSFSGRAPSSSARPPSSNAQPPSSNSQPQGSNSQPQGSNAQPQGSNAQPPGSNAQPVGFNAQPLGSNAQSPGSNAPQGAPSPWPAAERIQGNSKGPQSTPRM